MLTQHSSYFVSRRRSGRGFTLMEVALALIVFAMMTILFGAVFPMTIRGAQYGGNYAQGAMLAQHKMDQLRSAGATRLDQNDLAGLSIIDSPQPSGYPITSATSSTFSFTTADGLVNNGVVHGYFAPGSQGTVTIGDYTALHPTSGIPAQTMSYVTVTISWTNGSGVAKGSYSTSAIIAKT